ncbi:hypothetical protein O7627_16745 [Solwaraspora sp. WMMD1047]|uniref:hypothetical protein n=1 Tax=Solwaraspora sp. WMMD1047 TaxID=3016102 RepID=UPI00241665B6|nr:hypothetical protein [Solwaraspora sp. WMMD1047]MDG4830943.1 hypothetical protein [Solwaraspora sp. WMMD1047]
MSPPAPPARGQRFALFGECLLTGLLVTLAAVPVVTLLAALAAGAAQISAHVDGESTALRAFAGRLRSAYPGSAGWSLGAAGAFALLALDAAVLRTRVPGGGLVAVVSGLTAVGLAVLLLRAGALWRPGDRWPDLLRRAAHRTVVADRSGSLLLVLALGLLALVTWQLLPLLVPMIGCVVMAAVATERRP